MIPFGPVPSRRLGQSLGINNIPPKICSYSCVYCQLGRTLKMQVERQPFYEPEEILRAVKEKVKKAREAGGPVDYLTFVPDGEPTLDVNLGREINLLRELGLPIAVITNSSLIDHSDVRKDLMGADWVSLKMDAVDQGVWRRIIRPHRRLELKSILEGALEFAKTFRGELATETILVAGLNDSDPLLSGTADFLACLQPAVAYLSIPPPPPSATRCPPPSREFVHPR